MKYEISDKAILLAEGTDGKHSRVRKPIPLRPIPNMASTQLSFNRWRLTKFFTIEIKGLLYFLTVRSYFQ